MKAMRLIGCFFAVTLSLLASFVFAESYRLLPQDQVILRAMRWNDLTASYVQWEGVSGEYTVAADGTLMVPLVGQIEAQGKALGELSATLQMQFRREIGMAKSPHVALEIVGHQPIYVLGDVTSPGAYPFQPGLTAQQALALARGPLRPPMQLLNNRVDTQTLRFGGEIRLLSDQINAFEVEQQRLIADLDSLSPGTNANVTAPGGLEGDILAAEQSARQGQSERYQALRTMLKEQIVSLTEQLELRREQAAVTREELEKVSALKAKGLTVNTRVTDLTTAINGFEAERLTIEIALLSARQELNRTERDELFLFDSARTAALVRLNEIQQILATLRTRLATARILHAEVVAAGFSTDAQPVSEEVIQYRVTRNGALYDGDFKATATLLPGDTVEVTRIVFVIPVTD
ncbi:MAG: polysaccharide biosynthesis/export family protein [Rhodobacteraceae bacterium]|nr:polysaccharide biosynthesis/export family protein [Paracoccaceae bacterium]